MSLLAALYEHYLIITTMMTFTGGGLEVTLSSFSLAVVSGLVWVGGIVGVGIYIVRWKTFLPMQRRGSLFLSCFFTSIVFSLGQSGAAFSHYLIQLFPFVALFAAVSFDTLLKRTYCWQTPVALSLVIAIALVPIVPEYREIRSRLILDRGLKHGPAYEIADYIAKENPGEAHVYMMTEHIVYWFVDGKPLSASTTHPSNIGKNYLLDIIVGPGTTSKMEMAKIFAQKPAFVVKLEEVPYLESHKAARVYLQEALQQDYRLVKEIEQRQIYQRR